VGLRGALEKGKAMAKQINLGREVQKIESAFDKACGVLDQIEDAEAKHASDAKIESLGTRAAEAYAKASDQKDALLEAVEAAWDDFEQEYDGFWESR
jgi:hypothetical protein